MGKEELNLEQGNGWKSFRRSDEVINVVGQIRAGIKETRHKKKR